MTREVMNCLTWYANKVAETVQYQTWSDQFCRKKIKESTDKFLEELKKHIDWNDISIVEAHELGFKKWEESTDLFLIPLYLLPILPVGTELTDIFGNTVVYDGSNIDTDTRFGCLAYGINITTRRIQIV